MAQTPPVEFGRRLSLYVTRNLHKVPAKERREAVNVLLDSIEPGLAGRTRALEAKFRNNMSAEAALRAAIAQESSKGFTKELVERGRRDGPYHALAKGKGAAYGRMALGGIGSIGSSAFNFIKDGISSAGSFACDVLNNPLGQIGAAAAGGAYGGKEGAQLAVVGAQVGAAACASGEKQRTAPIYPQAPSQPAWLLPAAIGGGALLLILLLNK